MKSKRSRIATLISVLLAIAAVAFVAVKLYRKFFKKKQDALEEENDADLIEATAEEVDSEEPAAPAEEAVPAPAEESAPTEEPISAESAPEAPNAQAEQA